ncbi:hypothetical protein ACI8B_10038 [Acinetobacter proteolyticus]|uniref:Uncharacterized protein n=1 Tax=Acinetobacter proteolyticus TaxID=1776741 RepID=A0A653JZB9_9GAMM|nr:hypothetical protein ACI8B_10038 [Acinetobacter proteolyticus]
MDNLVRMATPLKDEGGTVFLFLNLKNGYIGDAHALDRLLNSLATRAI